MHGSMWRREETRPVGYSPRGPGASRRPYHDPGMVASQFRSPAKARQSILDFGPEFGPELGNSGLLGLH